jgi:hypothetical protein
MKAYQIKGKTVLTLLLAGLFVLCCTPITLDGQTTRETRNLPSFNAISLAMSGNIYLTQGEPQSVSIEADKSELDQIVTEVNGSRLVVKTKPGHWHNMGTVKIYITVPSIRDIGISGSGNVEIQNELQMDDLSLSVSGSGDIRISNLNARSTSATISGSGSISLAGDNKDAGSLNGVITGSGNIRAEDYVVNDARITITGSGSVRVNALKSLTTEITGSGNVQYKGSPMINAHATGSGRTRSL